MDLLIVLAAVFSAAGFVVWKFWAMVKPGPKTAGCSCTGSKKNGCGGCPLMKP